MKLSDEFKAWLPKAYRQPTTHYTEANMEVAFHAGAEAAVPAEWREVMDMLTDFEPIVMTSSSYGGRVFRVELGFRNLVERNKGHDFLRQIIHLRHLLAQVGGV